MQRLIGRLLDWLRRPAPDDDSAAYRAYTRDFDKTVRGADLDTVLGPLKGEAKQAWLAACAEFDLALVAWQTRHSIMALEISERVRQALNDEQLAGTAICLLVDQSGSMRGQNMLLAAAAANIAQDFLRRLGCAVEILGFTTVSWRGGESRKRWMRGYQPPRPGRLCDLLHIIYQTTGDPGWGTGGRLFHPMLRPDLPKENVDGEALEWAATRLREREEPQKILVVISDGAAVDDSTLMANTPQFLERHLRSTIANLQESQDIRLGAVGISFDVSRYYGLSTTVRTPSELGAALLSMLEVLLVGESKSGAEDIDPSLSD
jgi:cobaltochelatase CobT